MPKCVGYGCRSPVQSISKGRKSGQDFAYIWPGKNIIEHLDVLNLLGSHVHVQILLGQEACNGLSAALPDRIFEVLEHQKKPLSCTLEVCSRSSASQRTSSVEDVFDGFRAGDNDGIAVEKFDLTNNKLSYVSEYGAACREDLAKFLHQFEKSVQLQASYSSFVAHLL